MAEQVERELYFTDEFFPKFTERAVVVLECIKNKTEVLESDWDIVEEIHRLWMDGKFGWRKSLIPETIQTVGYNIGLFDTNNISTTANPTDFDDARDQILDGIVLDIPCIEPKKKKKCH